jgi:WD40 repeat protein
MQMMLTVVVGLTHNLETYLSVHLMILSSKSGTYIYSSALASTLVFSPRDRRSLGASQKPSGVLVGHTEGITYVSAKGDGRYVISNGKDQAMRLWDLRKMRSSQEFETIGQRNYGVHNFDYRFVKLRSSINQYLTPLIDTLIIQSPSIQLIHKIVA